MSGTGIESKRMHYENSLEFARSIDNNDDMAAIRRQFILPEELAAASGQACVYLAGNSLGLQPRRTREYIEAELDDWGKLGVEGHLHARHPWLSYHEFVTEASARLVGALAREVVVMNTLTVNLHLMMVSFYRPTKERHKIVIEKNAFPSDQYAVASQAGFHGYGPDAIIELTPREGCDTLETADILELLQKRGNEIALVLLGDVNYLSGQAFEVEIIASEARRQGARFGLNLAHGAGNLELNLHDWQVDFAVWCTYKYLNAGPGGLSGCFVHEKHGNSFDLPRFAGWWGHNKEDRFKMAPVFDPMAGAEGWQLSNPPIFQLAALRASLELFDQATMPKLRARSLKLTGYMEHLLNSLPSNSSGQFCTIITPSDPAQRGSQLSIRFKGEGKELLERFKKEGVVCDFREPDIIRATPTAMYNTFEDVFRFYEVVRRFALEQKQ